MYHVTRCPNCRTSFRITDAHLNAFEGKVRCGRCAFVFNALEHLGGAQAVPATEVPSSPGTGQTPIPAPIPAPALVVPPPAPEPVIAAVTISVPDLALAQTASPAYDPHPDADNRAAEDHAYGLDSVASQLEAAAEAERDDDTEQDSLASQSLQRLADALATERAADIGTTATVTPAVPADPVPVPAAAPASPPPAEPAAPPVRDLRTAWQFVPPPAAAATEPVAEDSATAETDPQPDTIEITGIDPWSSPDGADPLANIGKPGHEPTGVAAQDMIADFSPAPVHTEAGSTYRPILTHEDEALLRVPSRPSPLRWLWSIPALLAAIALLGQLAIHYRTEVAIQLPGIEPKLRRYCELVGCKLALPARAAYLRTEWNELVSLPDSPNLIQLSATLRNQAGFAQALPLLELTLTDDNERIVARKVFTVREYLAPLADGSPAAVPTSLLPNGDLRVFLQLDLGPLRSSGYSLNWFYPQEN
ncbi:DUF3426 domain-containing protein [Chitinimonas sp. BJYL2]|uniref:DUF3426 domain-containing protein n=1 Tax=Chitinimonas sp. BJYL2 TaxID=2976696 RepID=UPI0022B33C62|nr:DUF3426 domain-containing protein [Chitinimonas sp. BJYL2]